MRWHANVTRIDGLDFRSLMTTDHFSPFHFEDEPDDRALAAHALHRLDHAPAARACGLGRAAIVGTGHDLFAPRRARALCADHQRVVTAGDAPHGEEPALIPEDDTTCERHCAPTRRNGR